MRRHIALPKHFGAKISGRALAGITDPGYNRSLITRLCRDLASLPLYDPAGDTPATTGSSIHLSRGTREVFSRVPAQSFSSCSYGRGGGVGRGLGVGLILPAVGVGVAVAVAVAVGV